MDSGSLIIICKQDIWSCTFPERESPPGLCLKYLDRMMSDGRMRSITSVTCLITCPAGRSGGAEAAAAAAGFGALTS